MRRIVFEVWHKIVGNRVYMVEATVLQERRLESRKSPGNPTRLCDCLDAWLDLASRYLGDGREHFNA